MTGSQPHTHTYLPSVDGLRTIAVLSVFVFHLSPQTLSGGFVGVDIFFVISGYLITRILKTSIEADNLSFSGFYIRRIKRLFPAFAAVLIATAIVALFILNPLEIMKLARSSIATIAGVSNLYFYLDSGYFAPAAESQLLLHTWSLAVEEQFYLAWPLITLLVVTYVPAAQQIKVVLMLTLLCLIASILVSNVSPNMAFYLTPFRAAEFAIGGILCWLSPSQKSNAVPEFGTIIGLTLIAGSIVFINPVMRFPGWVVYIPCIGTALVIYFCRASRLGKLLIGNSTMVYLGRISYPLYLVHWPLILFAKRVHEQPLTINHKLMIFISGILLASLIYRFIEQPLKTAKPLWTENKSVVAVFASSVLVFILLFLGLHHFKGFPGRVSASISTIIDNVADEKHQRFKLLDSVCQIGESPDCEKKSRKVVTVIGDSHGPDGINALSPHYDEVDYFLQHAGGCPPLSLQDFDKFIKPPRQGYSTCLAHTQRLSNLNFYTDIDYLVISVSFNYWYTPELLDHFLTSTKIPDTVKILILGNAPRFNQPLPHLIAEHNSLKNLNEQIDSEINELTWKFEAQIKQTANKHGAKFISKLDYFCDTDSKHCQLFYGESNKLLTYDEHHLSFDAAYHYGKDLKTHTPNIDDLFKIGH